MNREGLSPHARKMLLGDRQCVGTNRDGQRCGKAPMVGQYVCEFHGGKTPFGLEAGRKRILALCEPVLGAFEEIVATWRAVRCPTCGNPTGDPTPVIRVGQLMLDRAGFHPTLLVQHAPPQNPFADLSLAELADRAEAVAIAMRAAADNEAAAAVPDRYEDAVLVEGTEPETEPLRLGSAPEGNEPKPG